MSPDTVRLLMVLKINFLYWVSGIRLSVIEALIQLYNAQVLPAIPKKVPLAHPVIWLIWPT